MSRLYALCCSCNVVVCGLELQGLDFRIGESEAEWANGLESYRRPSTIR